MSFVGCKACKSFSCKQRKGSNCTYFHAWSCRCCYHSIMTSWCRWMWVTRLVAQCVFHCYTACFEAKSPIFLMKPKLSPHLWFVKVWWCVVIFFAVGQHLWGNKMKRKDSRGWGVLVFFEGGGGCELMWPFPLTESQMQGNRKQEINAHNEVPATSWSQK